MHGATAPPTFVELMAPPPGSFPGAVVELEGPRGRMRIELKGVRDGRAGGAEPGVVELRGMIQITPQMRILVAVEAVDGRKGIDSLAQLCQEKIADRSFFMWRAMICGATCECPRLLFTKSSSVDTYSSTILSFKDRAISLVI